MLLCSGDLSFELWHSCCCVSVTQLKLTSASFSEMNRSSGAVFYSVKLFSSWFQPFGHTSPDRSPNLDVFLAREQRIVGILQLITGDAACQHASIKCSRVVTACSIHFAVCWFSSVLTAAACVNPMFASFKYLGLFCCCLLISNLKLLNRWLVQTVKHLVCGLQYIFYCLIDVGGNNIELAADWLAF